MQLIELKDMFRARHHL